MAISLQIHMRWQEVDSLVKDDNSIIPKPQEGLGVKDFIVLRESVT